MEVADSASASLNAINLARVRGLAEVGPDELLLGCLQAVSRFGVAQFGSWAFDLEALGVDWIQLPEPGNGNKVAYSEATVEIFDRAARIARIDGASGIRVEHLLAAFATEEGGLMGKLRETFAIESSAWRAAAAELPRAAPVSEASGVVAPVARHYLTPEETAETLGIHVQTVRAYVRSGKLPALRLAGERAIRIRRSDLEKVLEPLVPEKPNP